MLTRLGERIKLARLRRKFSSATVSARAGISRTTLYKVEAGESGVTLGTYLRVLAALGLSGDFDKLVADDHVGRRLQDLGLEPKLPAPRSRPRRVNAKNAVDAKASDEDTS